ncbi:hypothetical protein J7L68_06595 [bacterium]|nr:hypothetical protein [bacterium]
MRIVVKIGLFCFALLLFGCAKEGEPLARVGVVEINREDLTLQKTVYEKCYGQADKDSTEVLAELISNALEKAVLKAKYEIEPPESVMAEKEKWIDKNTKAPEIWRCKKKIYGENKEALYRDIISPILVNQKLHGMFSQDTLIHKSGRDSIAKIFKKVMEFPESLETIAGYDTFRMPKQVSIDKTLLKSGVEFVPDPIIDKVLVHLKPGEMWQNIVEDDYSYKIVRLLSENDSSYLCDGIILPKRSFDEWFRKYAIENIDIEIYDDYLKKSLIEKYPDLWWWKMLR